MPLQHVLDLTGLLFSFCGLLIIIRYGLPYKRMAQEVNLLEHQTVDQILTVVERVKIQKRAYLGIYLILAGLLFQMAAVFACAV